MEQTGFCENLRFPAVFCENLHLQNAVMSKKKSENQQKSAREIANSALFVPFSLSLLVPPESKNESKSLVPAFSLCRRAGIDTALVKAQFSFSQVHPPSKIEIEQENQTPRVASG